MRVQPTDLEVERRARAALSSTREPGSQWLASGVAEFGALELYEYLMSGRRHTGTAQEVARRLARVDPDRLLADGARRGLRYVVPGDEEWPAQVEDMAVAEPLGTLGGAPLGLWVRGPWRLDQLQRSVAVVGSRSATTYGCEVAAEIAAGVSEAGWVVVSGAAFGIDAAAHRGALVGGPSVALLACGADRAYPLAHESLIDEIAEAGAVVSETPPGGAPLKARFLSRNRLIAALTRGTLVVEAAVRSGALNTATWATRINRPLMGVPGPVTSAPSEGVHRLVRLGQASLVTTAADVLEFVGDMGEYLQVEARGLPRPGDGLSPVHRDVLEAVPVRRPAGEESIARLAGVPTADAAAALAQLRMQQLVQRVGVGWTLARQPPGASGDA